MSQTRSHADMRRSEICASCSCNIFKIAWDQWSPRLQRCHHRLPARRLKGPPPTNMHVADEARMSVKHSFMQALWGVKAAEFIHCSAQQPIMAGQSQCLLDASG